MDLETLSNNQQQPIPSTGSGGLNFTPANPRSKNKKILLILFILLLLIGSGVAYYFISIPDGGTMFSPIANGNNNNDNSKTVEHPLTGVKYTPEESASWIDVRPMAVMMNNYVDARPHSGIADADLVYEIVAEGGITRFLAFFLAETPDKIGPVRSTRHYYLTVVKELGDAMLMHIGWSPQALEAIETWPVRSLGRGGAEFWRDQDRINAGIAVEHTAYVSGSELRQLGMDLGWQGKDPDFRAWKFKDDSPVAATETAVGEEPLIQIDFWYEGEYSAIWKYDRGSNSYMRSTGFDTEGNPIPHKDQETDEQVQAKNVVVQFVAESSIAGDDKSRLDYELIGSGEGIIFMDGKAINATWLKETRDGRTLFYNENGEEIEFNRGKFWISVVPDRNKDQVTY